MEIKFTSPYYPTSTAEGIANIEELAQLSAYDDVSALAEPLVEEHIEEYANECVDTMGDLEAITDDPEEFRKLYVGYYFKHYPLELAASQSQE